MRCIHRKVSDELGKVDLNLSKCLSKHVLGPLRSPCLRTLAGVDIALIEMLSRQDTRSMSSHVYYIRTYS